MTAFVRLTVAKPLNKQQFAQWFDCVEQTLPTGLIGQAHLAPGVFSKFYRKRTPKGHFSYVVPLVRNLDASEIYRLVQAWDQQFAKHDFIIDYSQPGENIGTPSLDLATRKIEQALDSWGKQQHQRWMDSHIGDGWRYGVKLSVRDKTHPWLQPWESLPQAAKHTNFQAARDLLHTLNQFGYTLVQKPQA